MQRAMREGRVTSRDLVVQSLARIGTYDSVLHAVLAVNPNALAEAARLDRERARGHVRGPLHGIPVALKDNIQTTMMPTTGGALAFAGYVPPYEATLTANLREAGAVIIAKTGMTELANWVAGDPTPMPTNYNSIGGFGFNPFDPRRDLRDDTFDGRPALQTGGSSSGIGTNASFWAANVGTETSGSILSPSNQNMLAGIKPTVGRISRYGVIPITGDQDTPGPMARTVDGRCDHARRHSRARAPDPHDPATNACPPPPGHSYTRYLSAGGLKGARIGIPRAFFTTGSSCREIELRGGLTPAQQIAMANAIDVLKTQGAVIVDPANIPSVVDSDADNNFVKWNICSGADDGRGKDSDCAIGLKYGMKRDFNALAGVARRRVADQDADASCASGTSKHAHAGTLKYGQSNLDISDEMDVERDRARYRGRSGEGCPAGGTHGIDEVMAAERLDAICFPGSAARHFARASGIRRSSCRSAWCRTLRRSPFPAGFDAQPAPYRRQLRGTRLQRGASDRARICVRAGDEAARARRRTSLTEMKGSPMAFCEAPNYSSGTQLSNSLDPAAAPRPATTSLSC